MRCPRCHIGTMVLQHDRSMYLCSGCKYIQDNESEQFVVAQEFTDAPRRVKVTTHTIQRRPRKLKRTGRRPTGVDSERLKRLETCYTQASWRLREYVVPDRQLDSIWKRLVASVVAAYHSLSAIVARDHAGISSLQETFAASVRDECRQHRAFCGKAIPHLLASLACTTSLAVATYLFATELAGSIVAAPCALRHFAFRTPTPSPCITKVASCCRLLPLLVMPSVDRAQLLFDTKAVFTQVAAMCVSLQGYSSSSSVVEPWVDLALGLSGLFPQPLCGFHAFLLRPSQDAGAGGPALPYALQSMHRYTCTLLYLAYMVLAATRPPEQLSELAGTRLPARDIFSQDSMLYTLTDDTRTLFASLHLVNQTHGSFSSFPVHEFFDSADMPQTLATEAVAAEHKAPTVNSFDWIVCELAALCSTGVERFVSDAHGVARAALHSITRPDAPFSVNQS